MGSSLRPDPLTRYRDRARRLDTAGGGIRLAIDFLTSDQATRRR